MAVTDFIDDENRFISTDSALDITGFHDEATSNAVIYPRHLLFDPGSR